MRTVPSQLLDASKLPSPANDKDFAPWAPREGQPGAAEYLERLLIYPLG